MKILILGGYGVFGGRLAELLSDISEIEILICGRSLARATDFCGKFQGRASVTPVQLDRNQLDQRIETLHPDLVVDASGPFQDYGDRRYSVIETCISTGVNYLDFADAADFVFGVSQFDQAAKKAGVFVLSGVSSFPVLTAAVLREMAKDMDIVTVEGGIAPSPYAVIGLNVMRAVVGYAGAPVKLTRNGAQTQARALAESLRFTIAVPGRLPLRNIHFSLVDVPDLQVIPPEHETLRDIWMGAGPGPEILHRALNMLAKARAAFGLPSLLPLAGLFYKVLNLMKFGEHRGGMFIRARGLRNGETTEQSWHLLAEGDDGPYIPSMAIEAIIRKLLNNEPPDVGARPATKALELADYERLFEGRSIYSGFRKGDDSAAPLYRQILGPALDRLPDKVRTLHDASQSRKWEGNAEVRRGKGMFAKLICRMIGFPKDSPKSSVSVAFTPEKGGERWTRTFDGKAFTSFQKRGEGKNSYLLLERFGIIEVALALVVDEDKLFLIPRRWSVLGLPLPKFLLPSGESFETEEDGRFRFDIEIAAPLVGLIVSYRGT